MSFSTIPTPAPGNPVKPKPTVASMSISIDSAEASDAPALSALGIRTFTETFGNTAPKEDIAEYLAATYSDEAVLAWFPDPTKTTLVARDPERRVVGMVQLVRGETDPSVEGTAAEAALLQKLYVDSSVHGRGIGSKLAAAVEKMARQEGFTQLWLTVWPEQVKVQRLYEKLGYTRTGGELGFVVGTAVTIDYVFAKPL
jgi:ribosomal protein S18 acetylase RimI-like enzyme